MGITSKELERDKCYKYTGGLALDGQGPWKIVSVGPKFVRYRSWENPYGTSEFRWSPVRSHPRVLFNTFDNPGWEEVPDPSRPET